MVADSGLQLVLIREVVAELQEEAAHAPRRRVHGSQGRGVGAAGGAGVGAAEPTFGGHGMALLWPGPKRRVFGGGGRTARRCYGRRWRDGSGVRKVWRAE